MALSVLSGQSLEYYQETTTNAPSGGETAVLKFAALITSNLVMTIPIAMILGFICGYFVDAAPLKALILPFTFLMVYPMMVNLKLKKLVEGGDTKIQCVTQGLNFLIVPFVALGIALLAFPDKPFLVLGLVLTALLPTSGMTISYTGLSRGNMEAAIKMTVIGLILGSILAPFYLEWLLGAKIQIDLLAVMANIALIVFLPMAAGFATQLALIKRHGQAKFNKEVGPRLAPLSTYGVVGVVFVAMALKARSIADQPDILLTIIVPLILFYVANYALSIVVGRMFFSRDDAIALLYGSVMRNLSVALAVTINAFGEQGSEAALLISLGYIIQVQSAAWFVKYTDKIYGPKKAPVGAA
jgi:ACR3 family arsenite transporter